MFGRSKKGIDLTLSRIFGSVCLELVVSLLSACAPINTVPSPVATSSMLPRLLETATPTVPNQGQDNLSWHNALFVVLSTDQTQLLAAYEGETTLRVLYRFSPPYQAQVTFYPADFPVISKDGVWVTVVEDENRVPAGIQRIPLTDPTAATTILNWPGSQFEAIISPDGKRVAFLAAEKRCVAYEEHGEGYSCPKHVYVMDSDGNNIQRLTNNATDRCFLSWSPTNSLLAYQEVCDPAAAVLPQVYVVTLGPDNAPRRVTQISAVTGVLGAHGVGGTWSPDGKWLQWVANDTGPSDMYRLSRIDAEGNVTSEVPSGLLEGGSWSPDAKKLATITSDNTLVVWDIQNDVLTRVQLQNIEAFQPQRWLADGEHLVVADFVTDDQGNLIQCHWYMTGIDGARLIRFNVP